jgi:hypothetical protein
VSDVPVQKVFTDNKYYPHHMTTVECRLRSRPYSPRLVLGDDGRSTPLRQQASQPWSRCCVWHGRPLLCCYTSYRSDDGLSALRSVRSR